jgi:ubiquinone/menaquinone biosynthesis C-methylase UbiE
MDLVEALPRPTSTPGARHTLRTFGHATLVLLEDGVPLIATDPWLVGSVFWRSWWLEQDPTEEEIGLVRRAQHIYITHSHPDHLNLPTLRSLGKPSTLHPQFPHYPVPAYLAEHGFPTQVLERWVWHRLTDSVRIMSVPTFLDDSILVLETPHAIVFDLNDSTAPPRLLRHIRQRVTTARKPVVVLKSYSSASSGICTFRNGRRVPHRNKKAYVQAAQAKAEALGAQLFVPFASQAFFGRPDTAWANEYKVQFTELCEHWTAKQIEVALPFVSLDLDSLQFTSSYVGPRWNPDEAERAKIAERHAEETAFVLPSDFDERLKKYHDEIVAFRIVYPRGIGWRLATSGTERFYNSRTRRIEHKIPDAHDFVITLPDKVLYEALCNNILTDIGVTMFTRLDTKRGTTVTYGAFLLMGMHDYGYLKSVRNLAGGLAYYAPGVLGHTPRRVRADARLAADASRGQLPRPAGDRLRAMQNADAETIKGFGEEWSRFDQSRLTEDELLQMFEQYFSLFPWSQLPPNAVGFDLGCGSGRWATVVAKRVGRLHCIDPSSAALEVARTNLRGAHNCVFHLAGVDQIPLPDDSMDFGYSLGVLHHVPDPAEGVRACVRKLKRGAPFLLYLYYAFDNRPGWFRRIWQASNAGRLVISQLPFPLRLALSQVIAAGIYLPLARTASFLEAQGLSVETLPLSIYRKRSFYVMQTDALDRFGTRLEGRFTAEQIRQMMTDAGLTNIRFGKSPPYWCAVGQKA